MATQKYAAQSRAASSINVLLGLWLLASPWIFGYHTLGMGPLWNSVIIGAVIALLAAGRVYSPQPRTVGLSWVNLVLALWTIASPWVYHYAVNLDARWDNVLVGVVMAAFAIWSGGASTAEQRHLPGAAAHP
ncbi:MAG TPA: SPW repeat protein [Steroidobacteraceae bacterium]|nr:SPW repeat protein [Steroidobacteraceae bacterium]